MELIFFSDPVRPSNFESNGESTSIFDATTSEDGFFYDAIGTVIDKNLHTHNSLFIALKDLMQFNTFNLISILIFLESF